MQPSELLDLIKVAYGLTSDYQVMKRFGFSQTGISAWRNNRSFPDDNVLIKFADALDIDLGVLVLQSIIWRKKDPQIKNALQKVLDALAYCEIPEDIAEQQFNACQNLTEKKRITEPEISNYFNQLFKNN